MVGLPSFKRSNGLESLHQNRSEASKSQTDNLHLLFFQQAMDVDKKRPVWGKKKSSSSQGKKKTTTPFRWCFFFGSPFFSPGQNNRNLPKSVEFLQAFQHSTNVSSGGLQTPLEFFHCAPGSLLANDWSIDWLIVWSINWSIDCSIGHLQISSVWYLQTHKSALYLCILCLRSISWCI